MTCFSPTSEPKPRVVGLVRVSTQGQSTDDRAGLPRQVAAIARTVAVQRLDLIETIEIVVSGTQTRHHPQIVRLCQLLDRKQITGVVMADLDRLMRPDNFADYQLLDVFVNANAKIYLESCTHDCSSQMGKFQLMVSLFMAGNERKIILNRMNGARQILKEQGAHVWGIRQLPLGISYDRKTRVYSLNPNIAKIQEAFRLIDEAGIHNIREVGRRVGIAERTLHRLLRNPLFEGYKVYDSARAPKPILSKNGNFYHAKVPLPLEQVIRIKVLEEPPIAPDRWKRVQYVLEQKGKPWKARREVLPMGNILRNIAFCSVCGSRLYLAGDRRRPNTQGYYFCSRNYYKKRSKACSCGAINQRQVTLSTITLDFAGKVLANPVTVRAIIDHTLKSQASTLLEPCPQREEILATSDWDGRRKRVMRLFEMGQIAESELASRVAQIETEKKTFNARLAAKDAATKAIQLDRIMDKRIGLITRGAMALKRITDPTWQNNVLKRMFKEIHYEKGQITAFKLREEVFPAGNCENGIQSDSGSSPR